MENLQPVKPYIMVRLDQPEMKKNGIIRPVVEKFTSYTGTIVAVHHGCKLELGRKIVVPIRMLRPIPGGDLDMLVDVSDNTGDQNKHWVLLN